jgi:hypothetical protein
MFHHLLLFGFITFIFSHAARSQNVAWVNPPIAGIYTVYSADTVWQVGTTQTLSWETSYQTADLYLYQRNLVNEELYTTIVMGIFLLLINIHDNNG